MFKGFLKLISCVILNKNSIYFMKLFMYAELFVEK